jgi:WD40 repeat protein
MVWMTLVLAQVTAANADKLDITARCQGAKSNILCLAFSPDGKLLASGEVDRKVRLWDASTGKQIGILEGHTKQVAALAFSPDGKTLFSGGYDRSIRLWDVALGRQTQVQGPDPDPSKGQFGPDIDDMRAVFAKDGSVLVSGASIKLWDLHEKKERGYEFLINHFWYAFEADGKALWAVSGKKGDPEQKAEWFKRFDVKAGKVLDFWQGTQGASYERIALSENGALAAVIDSGGDGDKWKIEIWDLASKKRTATPGFHASTVNGMAFTRDGTALATASLDKTIKFWDVRSGRELATYRQSQGLMGLTFSADGKRMATAAVEIQIWEAK